MSNRFRLDTGCIIDQQENKVLSDVQVRNLLNKLNDENEQLKHDISFLKSDKDKLDKYHSRLVYHMNKFAGEKNYAETLSKLSEENEQFKSALKELREIGDYQAGRIKELNEENQQIESTIKEAYQSERTMIGKSVLKQLMETIQ